MDAWNSHDLDRIPRNYAMTSSTTRRSCAQMAEPGGPGADGRLVGQDQVRAYFAAALAGTPILHFETPVTVAVGSGSVSFVYASIKHLTAVETLVFAPAPDRGPGPLPLPGADRVVVMTGPATAENRRRSRHRLPGPIICGPTWNLPAWNQNPRSPLTTGSTAPASARSWGISPPA